MYKVGELLLVMHGQLIKNVAMHKNADELSVRMKLKDIPAGVYFLELRIGDALKEVRKIIKE